MDRLEVILEDRGKDLNELAERFNVVEKTGGSSDGLLSIKADIDWLKNEVASLKYMNISYL